MISPRKNFQEQVAGWPGVTAHAHRFGGTEFRLGSAEIGHLHPGGILDIPFTRAIRDALLEEGLAEKHHWVPDSGWTTFRMRSEKDLQHALWLMRLSYLRYSLKTASNPDEVFQTESSQLQLGARFTTLLRQFLPRSSHAVA